MAIRRLERERERGREGEIPLHETSLLYPAVLDEGISHGDCKIVSKCFPAVSSILFFFFFRGSLILGGRERERERDAFIEGNRFLNTV